LPYLLLLCCVHFLLNKVVNVEYTNPSKPIPLKLFVSITFSACILFVLYGTSAVKLLVLNTAFFLATKTSLNYKASMGPMVIWTAALMIMFFGSSLLDNFEFHHVLKSLAFLDNINGMDMKWDTALNFGVLRMISFGMDYYYALTLEKNHHRQQCVECRDKMDVDCQRARLEESLLKSQYNFVNYIGYLWYFPLYFAGPIITFNDFIKQCFEPLATPKETAVKYGLRWLATFSLMEIMMHSFYMIAIARERAWVGFTPYQIMLIGSFSLKHIWLKLLIIWRFFRFWAKTDGIETEENMTRCMCNQNSPSGN
jgi:D-alanyl-lipoteichoic acid acyltransferase DltB (MBOAT superfamily)